ncbi:hypothetical protein CMEL01_02088, partial [Colletotrichum melonis]
SRNDGSRCRVGVVVVVGLAGNATATVCVLVGRGFWGCKPIYAFRRMVWLILQRHTPYALSGTIGSWTKRGKLQWVVGTSREERHKLAWIANAPAGEHGGERAGAQPPR